MSNEALTDRPEFRALESHHKIMAPLHMRDMFGHDPARFEKFHIKHEGLLLDYSRHRVTEKTMELLMDLATACDVEGGRGRMFSGANINTSENRAVLHPALRGSVEKNVTADGENVPDFVDSTLKKMKALTDKIRADKKFTDIVNIGIGGSDLGVRAVCNALRAFSDGPTVHFAANIDKAALAPLLKKLKPENTLFIVVSKSFTTQETLVNAEAAKAWIAYHLDDEAIPNHFIAVTVNTEKAKSFGVPEQNILPMRAWIGGRMSVWGAAGLACAIAAGFENFRKFLDGARAMDKHFLSAKPEQNMPVIMALLGIWYRNFFNFPALAVIPYLQDLRTIPAWLQQLDMESNGKSVSREGELLNYATGPVIFGEPGTNAQHAFFQALHQGTDIVPCDFILAAGADNLSLNASALAQAKALMEGVTNKAQPHSHYPGNRPSSTIIMDRLDPFHLGMLLALYEHKVFVQGLVWNINSFDQWGVELGKNLSQDIVQALERKAETGNFDPTTNALMHYLKGRA